jgi:hypothetical protein
MRDCQMTRRGQPVIPAGPWAEEPAADLGARGAGCIARTPGEECTVRKRHAVTDRRRGCPRTPSCICSASLRRCHAAGLDRPITHIFDKKSACTRNGEQDLACPLVRDVRWANNQRRTWPPFCENLDRAYDWLYCSFLWDHREWAT